MTALLDGGADVNTASRYNVTALGFAAEGIATQYSDGDALSSATIEQVADAFVPLPGDPLSKGAGGDQTGEKLETPPPAAGGSHDSGGAPERGERPTLPGGGPDVPDADSDEYTNRPFQL